MFSVKTAKIKSGGGQKGVSIVLAIVVTAILLAIALGITAILISQIRMTSSMGDSVLSFFAADTGAERVLYEDKICRAIVVTEDCIPPSPCVDLLPGSGCAYGREGGTILDNLGSAAYEVVFDNGAIVISSKGKYRETQRAVEINREP